MQIGSKTTQTEINKGTMKMCVCACVCVRSTSLSRTYVHASTMLGAGLDIQASIQLFEDCNVTQLTAPSTSLDAVSQWQHICHVSMLISVTLLALSPLCCPIAASFLSLAQPFSPLYVHSPLLTLPFASMILCTCPTCLEHACMSVCVHAHTHHTHTHPNSPFHQSLHFCSFLRLRVSYCQRIHKQWSLLLCYILLTGIIVELDEAGFVPYSFE